MTNFEKIKAMTLEELANFLCDELGGKEECAETCPFWNDCSKKRNGARAWLESEDILI